MKAFLSPNRCYQADNSLIREHGILLKNAGCVLIGRRVGHETLCLSPTSATDMKKYVLELLKFS